MKSLIGGLGCIGLLACAEGKPVPDSAAVANAAKVLATQPVVPPLKPFQAPQAVAEKLPNGLNVVTIERPGDPLETLLFTTVRGADADGATPGVASMTSEMLQTGSAGRSASQIADEINALGTELGADANRQGQIYALTVLPSQLEAAASLLGDVVLAPNFDPKEFDRVKAKRLAGLVAQKAEPNVLANVTFQAALYGDGPYGHPIEGTEASIKAMTLADVKRFYASILAGDCAVFASGGVPAAQVRALIAKRFASLPAGATGPATVPPPPASVPRIILVDKPGAPQSVLRYGEAVSEVTPLSERVADSLFNTILGGGFTSRLNQNLREKHGYSYGAGSYFAWSRHGGPFSASSAVKADVTGPAVHEMEAEVSGILAQGLTPEELSKAKALSVEGLVEALESSGGTAQAFARLWMLGRSLDEISQQIPALQAITLDDVKAAVSKSLNGHALTLVIVGDAATVVPQLQKEGLGSPEIWAVEGHQAREGFRRFSQAGDGRYEVGNYLLA